MTLTNHALMKKHNRARVLNVLRTVSPISRSEIAELTNLDRKSITNFISELMSEGLVAEVGKRDNERGRPFTLLELERDALTCIGVKIGPDRVKGVLVNLTGEMIAYEEVELSGNPTVGEIGGVLEGVYRKLKALVTGTLHGVGLCLPGIIDMEQELVRHSVNIPSMDGVKLRDLVSAFASENLFFEDSSRAKALAEKWVGLGRDCGDFVCIDLDFGVGAGIIADRRLYRGPGEYAGEIGHIVVDKGGRMCRCGNRGCLEAYLSERVLVDEINAACSSNIRHIDEIDEVTPKVREVLEGAAQPFAVALSNVVNLLNPTTIIINGALMKFHEVLLPAVRREMENYCLRECLDRTEVIASDLENSAVLGAASLVLSDIYEVAGHAYV